VQVTVAEGPALSLTNVKNLVATGFEFDGAAGQGLTVAGERAGEVTISSKSIAAAPKAIAVDEALVKIEE
jgi:hypothetical protein